MSNQATDTIIVKGSVDEVYKLWADFENFPKFMEPIKSVEKIDDRRSRWVVEGPFDTTIQWQAETTTLEENKRIAWNSIEGDVKTSGQVTFMQLPEDQTQVTVTLQYTPKAGLSSVIADKLFGDLEGQLKENLRRFKVFAEEEIGS